MLVSGKTNPHIPPTPSLSHVSVQKAIPKIKKDFFEDSFLFCCVLLRICYCSPMTKNRRYKVIGVSSAKTQKGESLGYLTGIVYLSPSDTGETGLNFCPWAGNCKKICLDTAGRGAFSSVQKGRKRKAHAWAFDQRHACRFLFPLPVSRACDPCQKVQQDAHLLHLLAHTRACHPMPTHGFWKL